MTITNEIINLFLFIFYLISKVGVISLWPLSFDLRVEPFDFLRPERFVGCFEYERNVVEAGVVDEHCEEL